MCTLLCYIALISEIQIAMAEIIWLGKVTNNQYDCHYHHHHHQKDAIVSIGTSTNGTGRVVKRNSIMLFRIKSWQIWKDLAAGGFGKLLKDTTMRMGGRGRGGSRPIQWLSLYLEELSSEIISTNLIGRQITTMALPAQTQASYWSMGVKSATEAAVHWSQLSAPAIWLVENAANINTW